MLDIADKKTLEEYMVSRGIVGRDEAYFLTYCKGGVSGTVAFLQKGDKAMIIKQALGQLKVKETWLCDPNRMDIEQRSNAIYHRLVPENAPEVYFYDAENYIFGREAVPEHCPMWKTDLLDGLLDFIVARKSIESLVIVHNACAVDPEVPVVFADKKIFYELRISPYIEFTVQKYPQLAAYAKPVLEELMGPGVTLVHGDFSPKNILVNGRGISILDYEVAHYGHPSFDLAFFSNHFILKSVKNKQWAAAYLNMLEYMLDIYFARMECMDKDALEKSYVRLLALLMLARVDGKSPAEYITEEADKAALRAMAFAIVQNGVTRKSDMFALILSHIRNI